MKTPKVRATDLITVMDLNREEILSLFNFAARLKKDQGKGKTHKILDKKSLAMIFEKSSTRTRVSFETGITQLGGHALFLSSDDIQLKRGETINDTARVLCRYVDAIMIRTFSHDDVINLAKHSTVPVINGLTDSHHPCQALTDLFTIYENNKDLTDVKVTYIGDGNNVATSLMLCAAIMGTSISIACPKQYSPDIHAVDIAYQLSSISGSEIVITDDIDKAIRDSDYLYTDVWISMGEEKKAARKKKLLNKYRITSDMLAKCPPHCRVMHCLPAHRGEEIDADVIESPQSIVFEQAENRLHVQKAIMCALMRK